MASTRTTRTATTPRGGTGNAVALCGPATLPAPSTLLLFLLCCGTGGRIVGVGAYSCASWNSNLLRARAAANVAANSHRRTALHSSRDGVLPAENSVSAAESDGAARWPRHALLISSFTDGVARSDRAGSFLRNCLVDRLYREHVVGRREEAVRESVSASPCAGPDIDALNRLEEADAVLAGSFRRGDDVGVDGDDDDAAAAAVDGGESMLERGDDVTDEMLELVLSSGGETGPVDGRAAPSPEVRMVYIPTAMYALRRDSNNTPGKQRQRARADGRKRRSIVIETVKEMLPGIPILAVTLDLDDGSIKQPVGCDDASLFPKEGRESIADWNPNLVYVEGGNTFWLQHCLSKRGWQDLLRDACTGDNAAVYCGKSAGAIVAGWSVETATWKGWDDPSIVPGMVQPDDWRGVGGMRMVGCASVFPHMSNEWEDVVAEKSIQLENDQVVCLEESDVCCVEGAQRTFTIVTRDYETR